MTVMGKKEMPPKVIFKKNYASLQTDRGRAEGERHPDRAVLARVRRGRRRTGVEQGNRG